MKKPVIWFLTFLLTIGAIMVPSSVHAADRKSGIVAIPVTTGLTGNNNSAKSYILDLPSGVTASAVQTSSLKYSGPNETVGHATLENGKLKITLKGVSNQNIFPVNGFKGDVDENFETNIGNSIWRYSDGRRWQINDYNPSKDQMVSYNRNATDSAMPSSDPPKTLVNAMSSQSTVGLAWYTDSGERVDSQYVQSSVQIKEKSKDSHVKEVKFNNGKIITSHYIAGGGDRWRDQTSEATMPITQHVQGRFYYANVQYYYTATAKLTTYSYSGSITFDYSLPEDATLNATATLEAPNPNPTKLNGQKVDVNIKVNGELLSYTDSTNIEEWVFYAKEKNKNDTLQMKKEYSKVLTASKDFEFKIPAARVVSDNFKQDYALTVVVRFKKPVLMKNGTITSLEQSLEVSAGVYKNTNPVTYPSVPVTPTKPEGKPPIARISAPKYIKAGDNMGVYGGASSDPDGYITDYSWGTGGAQGEIGNAARGTIWYTREQVGQTYPISLTVVDNDGMIGSTSTEVTVIEPLPSASISIEGTLKENRKTTLVNKSQSPTRFPLVSAKTQVTISAVSGALNSDILFSGTLTEFESKDVLFKKPGKYKATIYVENTLGYSDSSEITFDIAPDERPFAYFSMPGNIYRDPENGGKALLPLDDMSFSPDKDILVRRIWQYRYDSDNNGDLSNESWTTFSEENTTRLNLELYEVGKYEIKLTVIEEFGQPTIESFVTDADRKRTDSDSTQAAIERIVSVENRAPEVDWDL